MEVFLISKEFLLNGDIRDREVRLVDTDGSQLGIMSVMEAQKMAYSKNLDLVKIAPKATPPVCKIMDYGKFKFEEAKKEREARKNQKIVVVKEIRFSPSIDTHDFNTKAGHAIKFLQNGDKVKVTVRFRGRELHHASIGESLLNKFSEAVSEVGQIEKRPKLEGKNMFMFVLPKN